MPRTGGLSKSRYVIGLQCPKRLWWTVHEPDAPELTVDGAPDPILERGERIGELARTYVPGGRLIDRPRHEIRQRVEATKQALADHVPAIYEASFLEDDIFVSVDILERRKRQFVLTEVKSTTKVKAEHLPDVAVQLHVLRRAGVPVERAEVMHLNRECRHPNLKKLFVRKAVTRRVGSHARAVPKRAGEMLSILAGPLPDHPIGAHCSDPYPCPFSARCGPELPEHHVGTLYGIRRKKVEALVADGIETIQQLPRGFATASVVKRQIKSVRKNDVIVERGLRRALRTLKRPIAFLDFETVLLAVPVWPGCRPYDQVPVQLSCHVLDKAGNLRHQAWLADGPEDPRQAFAQALVAACQGAATVVAYSAGFERGRIQELGEAVPALARDLAAIEGRLVDLLPIVRDHVYHPALRGSFSLKSVLPALVPGFGYEDLDIRDGAAAAIALEAVLFGAASAERERLRTDLLRYCERDTKAMVELHRRLESIVPSARTR
jgi:predicted RecB family nuclease